MGAGAEGEEGFDVELGGGGGGDGGAADGGRLVGFVEGEEVSWGVLGGEERGEGVCEGGGVGRGGGETVEHGSEGEGEG